MLRAESVYASLTFRDSVQAALCALRVIKKVPELTDHFVTKAKNLLTDRNHGVLLSAITLVNEMCTIDPAVLEEFRNVRDISAVKVSSSVSSSVGLPFLLEDVVALV